MWMQWHRLDHMQTICTSLQTDNHTSTSSVNYFKALAALLDAEPTASNYRRTTTSSPKISVYAFQLRQRFCGCIEQAGRPVSLRVIMAGALVVVLLTLNLAVGHVDACYLRNCPIGGKRTVDDDDSLAPWINRVRYRPHDVSPRITICSVLLFSRPRSDGWPHHGLTFPIYPCPLSF